MRLQEIGFRLRAARLEQRRTQAQLAKAAGVSRTTLNQLESGLVLDLGVQRLGAILREVGLDLLIGQSNSDPRQISSAWRPPAPASAIARPCPKTN